MKFSCDRCGKKYATAEAPAPGRVYKLKCKACGHVIVVKTPSGAPAVTPSPADEPIASRVSSISLPAAQPPEVDVTVEPPRTEPPPPFQMPEATPVPSREAEPTAEISMMAEVTGQRAPEAGAGYVDLFADAPAPPPPPPAPVSDDPFLKAARDSLPEGFAGGKPTLADPFADMRDELDAADSAREAPPPPPARPVPPPAAFAAPARVEDKKKSGLPVALIGVGFAAVLGIVVVVAVTSGKKPPPAPEKPAAPVAAVAPTPPPPPPPPAPAPELAKAEPARPEPRPEKRAEPAPRKDDKKAEQARLDAERKREEARAEADRKKEQARLEAERKKEQARLDAERKREEDRRREEERKRAEEQKRLAKAEAAKPKESDKPVQLPDAATALSPEAVQRVVNSSRRAFENCIAEASKKGTDTKFDGRKVALRLNVNPNGMVTYPTLDDVTLNRTDLGECLKGAARLMVFPKFSGDVFHVEVPLTLR